MNVFQVRRQLLKNVDIIGATTTGASKLTSLLKVYIAIGVVSCAHIIVQGVAPRVLLVEEAGQVLEAHILASLVPSVEHLICIGDPLQLRPTLNNYGAYSQMRRNNLRSLIAALSMDNKRGAALYRFDMSLMERLSAELQMSQIDVQRRMRPQVSTLIR
jgi:superfamily I DNA and/or RNA helicase